MSPELIDKVIRDGHQISEKIKNARTTAEIDVLKEEIESYSNFVDANFGIIDEFSEPDEKHSELSFYLQIAKETKERHLDYSQGNAENYGNEGVKDFEEYLDSKEWVKNSAG